MSGFILMISFIFLLSILLLNSDVEMNLGLKL